MKTMKQFSGLCIAMFMCLLALSCKKQKNYTVNWKISQIIDSVTGPNYTNPGYTVYQISYYKDTSVSEIITGYSPDNFNFTSTQYFYYSLGQFVMSYSPVVKSGDTFLLNASSMITRSRNGNTRQTDLTYNNDNELLSYTSIYLPTGDKTMYEYTWSGGNIIKKSITSTQFETYEYYEDQPCRPGDGIQLQDFLKYGRSLIKNKNLVKVIKVGSANYFHTKCYSYTFDNSNRIIKATLLTSYIGDTDTTTEVFHFRY